MSKTKPFSIAKRLAQCYTSLDAYSDFNALAWLKVLRMRALACIARCTRTILSCSDCILSLRSNAYMTHR
jgi:hypothetical protein